MTSGGGAGEGVIAVESRYQELGTSPLIFVSILAALAAVSTLVYMAG